MLTVLMVIQTILSVLLITLILLQKGKGANMGVSFGAGASDTLFGASGAMSFFAKITWALVFLFMLNSVAISYYVYKSQTQSSIFTTSSPKAPK